jgi:Ca-activated chloride channel family protein
MTFAWPFMLAGLLLIPLAIALYVRSQRRGRKYVARFTNVDLLASVVEARPGWRRHLPPLLVLLALTALAVALARPHAVVAVPREQATVVLATDISGSMTATDVEPNRIVAAREAGERLIDKLPDGARAGLLAFSQSADLLVPPTEDTERVRNALDGLRAQGGTAMGDAIERAARASREGSDNREAPATVVLLSDGASTTGEQTPTEAAAEARRLGVRVNTVALGTPDGEVEVPSPLGGTQRQSVPPDTETLQEVARTTGGRYFAAADAKELDNAFDDLGSRIGFRTERTEVTAGFAAGAMVLTLIAAGLSLRWFGRIP